MLWKILLTCLALIVLDSCDIAQAGQLELGVGKALNNTNSKLPGYVYSVHGIQHIAGMWNMDIGYTRLGKSQLAENAAITTVGSVYDYSGYKIGLGVIAGASYSAAVWWDAMRPDEECGVEGCGRRYDNDGQHFSRACHLCGGVLIISHKWNRVGIQLEYYGLRHMTPTFQGIVVQATYTIGKL